LSRTSYQQIFTGLLKLPVGITKDQIDTAAGFMLSPGGLKAKTYNITQFTDPAKPTQIFMMFNKNELMKAIPNNGAVELTVTGKLKSGQVFSGSSIVTIKN
jgi:hypothetical protein